MAIADLQILLFRGSDAKSIGPVLLDMLNYLEPLDFAEPRAAVQGWIASADAGELSLNKTPEQSYLAKS
jgi:hypothetical protein